MPTTVVCFHCGLAAAVDLDRRPTTIGYDFGDWARRCASPDVDGATACANMRAILLALGVQLDQAFAMVECRLDTKSKREG